MRFVQYVGIVSQHFSTKYSHFVLLIVFVSLVGHCVPSTRLSLQITTVPYMTRCLSGGTICPFSRDPVMVSPYLFTTLHFAPRTRSGQLISTAMEKTRTGHSLLRKMSNIRTGHDDGGDQVLFFMLLRIV